MSLVALLVLAAGGVITLIAKSSQKQFLRQQTQLGELNGHIEEMYGGHQVMRVFMVRKIELLSFLRSIIGFKRALGRLSSFLA